MANSAHDLNKEAAKVEDLTIDEVQEGQVKGGSADRAGSDPGAADYPNIKFTVSEEYAHD